MFNYEDKKTKNIEKNEKNYSNIIHTIGNHNYDLAFKALALIKITTMHRLSIIKISKVSDIKTKTQNKQTNKKEVILCKGNVQVKYDLIFNFIVFERIYIQTYI